MMNLATKYRTILKEYGIVTPLRLAHFFAQIHHESNLKPLEENLNYSAQGLRKIFKKYFSELEAIQYARKPEAIANRVYANRMGNGNESSGDGWKYRGRGFIQLTGKNNYRDITNDTGIDYFGTTVNLAAKIQAVIGAAEIGVTREYLNNTEVKEYLQKNSLTLLTRPLKSGFSDVPIEVSVLRV